MEFKSYKTPFNRVNNLSLMYKFTHTHTHIHIHIYPRIYKRSSGKPLKEWHGVHVDGAGIVVKLNLRSNHLQGELPDCLALLTAVNYLDVSSNQIRGNVPVETLCKMVALKDGWLSQNPINITAYDKTRVRELLPKCIMRY